MRFVRGKVRDRRILIPVGIRAFSDDPTATPNFTFHEFTALLDTGASRTCVSQNVIDRVGLVGRGQIPVGNVKRTEMHETYLFYVGVWPSTNDGALPAVFGIGDEIMGIDGGDSRFYDVLLGMDIVTRGALKVGLDGSFRAWVPRLSRGFLDEFGEEAGLAAVQRERHHAL